ncbi:MAG: phosphoribosylformylglycinamidine synthase subunit PurS [Bacteroidota bacterium]|jgi:phosphoribosylformylglycinamidine synthase PurS subunit
MKYTASVKIMPNKNLLDPQGKAVLLGLKNLNLSTINDVRIGKSIDLEIEANSIEQAKENVEIACKKLLANSVMEYFEISITPQS